MSDIFKITPQKERRLFSAFFIGIIAGVISAFIKSGTEDLLPPRTPDRIAPPVKVLDELGIDWHNLAYHYSDQVVYWGGNVVHILFSVAAAVFYCMAAEIFPRIKLLQGLVFGLLFAIVCHGIILPTLDLSPGLSHLPFDEIASEILGTFLWIWSIELLRISLREKFSGAVA